MAQLVVQPSGAKVGLATAAGRRTLVSALLEAGRNAHAAKARRFFVRVDRDEAGGITSLDVADDGEGIELAAVQRVLESPHMEPTPGWPGSCFGLGMAILLANAERLAMTVRDGGGRTVVWQRQPDGVAFTVTDGDLPRRALGGLRTQIQLDGLHPGSQLDDADEVLSRLPIGPELEVRLDDVLGRREIQPRSYGGALVASGSLTASWIGPEGAGSGDANYELWQLDQPARPHARAAAPGIDVRRDGVVVDRTTFGIPIRRTQIGRVTGVVNVGSWYVLDPATGGPLGRRGSARALARAARREIETLMAGFPPKEPDPDPSRLARIASEITQRLSKAIVTRPSLAPMLDAESAGRPFRRVTDIAWASPDESPPTLGPARSGLRVTWSVQAQASAGPAWLDTRTGRIVVNYRHPLRSMLATATGTRGDELWGMLAASLVINDLRQGGDGALTEARAAVELATLALSDTSRPRSTRGPRESEQRAADTAEYRRQLESQTVLT